jgi:hypothetical protein
MKYKVFTRFFAISLIINLFFAFFSFFSMINIFLTQFKWNRIFFHLFIIWWLFLTISCKKKIDQNEIFRIGKVKCDIQPAFLKNIGFKTERCVYTTFLNNVKGVAIIEMPLNSTDTNNLKVYQHDSWKNHGMMGSLTAGKDGCEYTAPVPFINTLGKPLSEINTVFKIEPKSGIMKEFAILPKPDSSNGVVPFGVLGLYYDCHSDRLFASSVAGSTKDKENGVIYSIDPKTGEIKDQLKGFDAFGLFVCGITSEKILYFGLARNSRVFGIELDAEGNFVGEPVEKFSLANLGPRGDDKARRIRLNKLNYLEINGVEFNYNLTANTETPHAVYQFEYNENNKNWIVKNVY